MSRNNKYRFDIRGLLNRKQSKPVSSPTEEQKNVRRHRQEGFNDAFSAPQNESADDKLSHNHSTDNPPILTGRPNELTSDDAVAELALPHQPALAKIINGILLSPQYS
jgi:hypothetical protein